MKVTKKASKQITQEELEELNLQTEAETSPENGVNAEPLEVQLRSMQKSAIKAFKDIEKHEGDIEWIRKAMSHFQKELKLNYATKQEFRKP